MMITYLANLKNQVRSRRNSKQSSSQKISTQIFKHLKYKSSNLNPSFRKSNRRNCKKKKINKTKTLKSLKLRNNQSNHKKLKKVKLRNLLRKAKIMKQLIRKLQEANNKKETNQMKRKTHNLKLILLKNSMIHRLKVKLKKVRK